VIDLNKEAYELQRTEKRIVVLTGAGHLFEEPGALEEVAKLAADWFLHYLADGAD
jgi:putative phosphoribosyl transferase